jgi:hypothetical protein
MNNKSKYIIFPDAVYLINVAGEYRDVLGKELLQAYLTQEFFHTPEHSDTDKSLF